MNVFVIHRFSDKKCLSKVLKDIKKTIKININFTLLNSSEGQAWKSKALKKLNEAEVVLVYNPEQCALSDNAHWEIDKAESLKKYVLNIEPETTPIEISKILTACYNFNEEFLVCFSDQNSNRFDLYKMMVETSESLIERRQKTNTFFITIMGSILTVGGLLHKIGILTLNSVGFVFFYSVVGLLLCNSWRNLLDNYGKLNTAKFQVILHLEKLLGDQIFNAEWIALGKGMRSEKYRSFTKTEKNVPLYIAIIFFILTISISIIRIIG